MRRSLPQTHNVHHPVSANLSYEDQKAEAARAAGIFRASRLLKFFKHFQLVLETNPANEDGKGTVFRFNTIFETIYNVVNVNEGPFLLSDLTTSADLALFYTMNGLFYAFPRRMKNVEESSPFISSLVIPSLTIRANRKLQPRLQALRSD